MSTLSYLRSALIRADKRLAKYEARRGELADALRKDPTARNAKALSNLKADASYVAAAHAVTNLTAALNREELRVSATADARL